MRESTGPATGGEVRGVREVLDVRGLSVSFPAPGGSVDAVRDVSLRVGEREIVGLVGESGSGKSVTSLAIMGLILRSGGSVDARSIRFSGQELLRLSSSSLRRLRGRELSMIFQEPMTSLNPAYSVGEQIAEVVRVHLGLKRRESRQRAVAALREVGIPKADRRADSFPHEFSGGMRQRVMLAMAIVCGPKLLIADEPTTALDVTVQAQVLDLIKDLRDEIGMSILFITHDLGVIAELCDRVVVMYAGQVMEEAGVLPTFARPGHPYTEGLLASMPQNSETGKRLTSIPGAAPRPGSLPTGCPFRTRCKYALEECQHGPIPLAHVDVARWSRCLRAGELLDVERAPE